MKKLDPTPEQRASELLSGLIQQQEELGPLGQHLVMLMLCAGIQPERRTPLECEFHVPPLTLQ
jgi:hypothetical protein